MAQIVYGDREVMGHMLFGAPDPYIHQYMNEVNNYFGSKLTDIGRSFVNTASQVFTRMESSEAMRIAKAAMRKLNTFVNRDVIQYIPEIEKLQEAPTSMVRYIMAYPELRDLYHNGRIEGYGERYIDIYPDLSGWNHPDYQAVYHGWMHTVVEPICASVSETDLADGITEVNQDVVYEEYDVCDIIVHDDDDPEFINLTDEEAQLIIHAHHLAQDAIDERRDPTSYYDSQIL